MEGKQTIHAVAKKTWKYIRIVMRVIGKTILVMLKTIAILSLFAALAGSVIGVYKIYPIYKDYKSQVDGMVENSTLDTFRLQEASFIYDADGAVLAKLTGDEDSTYLNYDQIPEDAVNAFIAIEDRTFWNNPGIDVRGILRVGIEFLRTEGEEMHGASTITQQLARNRFLTREVSIERKAKEMLIALDLTKKYTKEQIMEFYINDISFANTYYGLEAAARGYFDKNADELTLSQTAYLCAIPNSPTYYNPYNHPENAITRRDKILQDMRELEYITEDEYQEALAETITVQRRQAPIRNYETTYAIDCAIRYLMRMDGFEFKYGFRDQEEYKTYRSNYDDVYESERDKLYTGGYTLYTSLDPAKQQIAQEALDNVLTFDNETAENGIYLLQGAATVIDNETGKVVAIVGGRSQETETYTLNRAFQSFRQPGSAIKPLIVYGPALENGYKSTSSVRNIKVDDAKKKGAVIQQLPGEEMPLRNAVERSRNGVAMFLYDAITPELGMAYLTQMRFDNIVPDDYFPASSLGGFTYGATTEEMAGAYSALANYGMYQEPTCLLRLIDRHGNDVFEDYPEYRVYQENAAKTMTDILKGVIRRGTASSMGWRLPIDAAGKTGTTNGSKDGWFCGMTPYYTMSVWVGYDQPKMLSSLYGGTYPATIWKNAMLQLVDGLEPAVFEKPEKETGFGDGTDYLARHEDEEELSNGYTVGDYRADHALADQAQKLLEEAGRTGGRGLRSEADSLINQIKSQDMKNRIRGVKTYVAPQETVPVLPPDFVWPVPEEQQPTAPPETVPAGPGSDIPYQPPQPQEPAGPGSVIIE